MRLSEHKILFLRELVSLLRELFEFDKGTNLMGAFCVVAYNGCTTARPKGHVRSKPPTKNNINQYKDLYVTLDEIRLRKSDFPNIYSLIYLIAPQLLCSNCKKIEMQKLRKWFAGGFVTEYLFESIKIDGYDKSSFYF